MHTTPKTFSNWAPTSVGTEEMLGIDMVSDVLPDMICKHYVAGLAPGGRHLSVQISQPPDLHGCAPSAISTCLNTKIVKADPLKKLAESASGVASTEALGSVF